MRDRILIVIFLPNNQHPGFIMFMNELMKTFQKQTLVLNNRPTFLIIDPRNEAYRLQPHKLSHPVRSKKEGSFSRRFPRVQKTQHSCALTLIRFTHSVRLAIWFSRDWFKAMACTPVFRVKFGNVPSVILVHDLIWRGAPL
jgi:hypothetical protein